MRKIFKYLLIFVVVFFILFLSFFYFYKANVINNLEVKKRIVDSKWSELFENSSMRINLLITIVSTAKSKGIVFDSLNIITENNFTRRHLYKYECSLDFAKQEFDLNKEYMKYSAKHKNDSVLKQNEKFNLITQLKINDEKINLIIDDYNNRALDYNKYISIFPNFFFAKKNGFTKKKYFTIKYGIENKDPILKSKELPEWAKDIDTL